MTDTQRSSLRDRARRLVPGLGRLFPLGRVAIIRLHGPIGGSARTLELVELAQRLRELSRVPAVVLDVDSPGGSATASDELFLAFERLAAGRRRRRSSGTRGAVASVTLAGPPERMMARAPNARCGRGRRRRGGSRNTRRIRGPGGRSTG